MITVRTSFDHLITFDAQLIYRFIKRVQFVLILYQLGTRKILMNPLITRATLIEVTVGTVKDSLSLCNSIDFSTSKATVHSLGIKMFEIS
jgi:hypothetical protein